MRLIRITLTVPLQKETFVQQALDALEISFEVELSLTGIKATGQPARTFILYATPEENLLWWAQLERYDLDRFATREEINYDPGEWIRRWQDYYEWTCISPHLAVGPDFKDNPYPVAHQVRIKPGQSFGTGVHASTRIALELMEPHLHKGVTLLDVGCGSGILAIAAALHLAEVPAFDIDGQSVTEAHANALLNQVNPNLFTGTINAVAESFEVVAANLLSFRLLSMADALQSAVRPGGILILSGLREADSHTFANRFFPTGAPFSMTAEVHRDDWWGAAFRREQ